MNSLQQPLPGMIPGMPQMADNWLMRGMNNPLTHMGMGLLAASAPRMSYTPEGATTNYGAGLLGGMQSYQNYQQGLLGQQFRQAQIQAANERLAMERERMEMERAQAEQEAQIRRDRAEAGMRMGGLISDPGQRALYSDALAATGDPMKAWGLANPAEKELPSDVREALWYQSASPEQRRAYMESKIAGRPVTNIINTPPPTYRGTPGGGTAVLRPDTNAPAGVRVDEVIPGVPERDPAETAAATKEAQMRVVKSDAYKSGVSLIDAYARAGDAATRTSGLLGIAMPGDKNIQAEQARGALVTWWAKNVLGTPGAEPSPALYKQAEDQIPDFSGPWDSRRLPAAVDGLKQLALTLLAEKYDDIPPGGVVRGK